MLSKFNTLEKELYKYNLEPSKNIDLIDFCKANKENYPIMFNVFLRIFCIPAI